MFSLYGFNLERWILNKSLYVGDKSDMMHRWRNIKS